MSFNYEADDESTKTLEDLFNAYEMAIFENIVMYIIDCQSMSDDVMTR